MFISEENDYIEVVCGVLEGKYIDELEFSQFLDSRVKFDDLCLLNINIRSLSKNFDELQRLVNFSSKISIITLTETWLKSASTATALLPGYNFLHNPRKDKTGGGVGIFVSSKFNSQTIQNLTCMTPDIETIFVEIQLNKSIKLLVGSVYRPPNSSYDNFISRLSEILKICHRF